ncbi:MAG: hypothetical protein HYT79_05110 [Elusimicrobia bacterium]|nr:hypothetical protein [Elusimicrobiota bacterium]
MKFSAKAKQWFYISLGVIALVEIIAPRLFHGHVHFDFEHFPAWGSLYGLVSCVLIIVVSKFIGQFWLMRPENYYEESGRGKK